MVNFNGLLTDFSNQRVEFFPAPLAIGVAEQRQLDDDPQLRGPIQKPVLIVTEWGGFSASRQSASPAEQPI